MEAREFVPGAWTLYLLADGSREFVREFLEELKSERPREYKKIFARLSAAANNGPSRNTQHFRQIQGVSGQLAELKADQVRVMCFFDGPRRIVLTHGFIKKQNRTDPEEIKRAIRLRDAYLRERASRRGRGS